MKIALYLFALIILSFGEVYAANRVGEVEAQIREDISKFLKRLYPESKYTLDVQVTPRNNRGPGKSSEDLPFFDFADSEQLDPWDNADISIFVLYGKIDHVRITINLENDVKISNKESLVNQLLKDIRLVPGRDSVEFNLIDVPFFERKWGSVFKNEYYLTSFLMAFVVLICGLLVVGVLNKKLNLSQLVQAEAKKVNEQNSESSQAAPSMNIPMSMPETASAANSGPGRSDQISLNDPTKTLELAREKILDILKTQTFPLLTDMITLEKFLQEDPMGFAQLVYEFPLEQQNEIFSLGRGDKWYQGFSEIGYFSSKLIFVLETMLRQRRFKSSREFEMLLIQCWRMGDGCEDFLREVDRKDIMSILAYLPKNVAIPLARKVLPGAWGSLLSSDDIKPIAEVDKIMNLLKKAQQLTPLLEKKSLDLYLNRKDLLDYLSVCEVNEEKEIYLISDKNSGLETVRPPFYPFFDLDDEEKRKIYLNWGPQQWALILFNVPRDFRHKFDTILNDKEKYLLSIHLSALDRSRPDLKLRGKLRKKVGKLCLEIKRKKNHDVREDGTEVMSNEEVA